MARIAWDFWKAYAEKIGHYQTLVILAAIYCLVVGPIWLVGRVTGHRFLPSNTAKASGMRGTRTTAHSGPVTFWRAAAMGLARLDDMKKQG